LVSGRLLEKNFQELIYLFGVNGDAKEKVPFNFWCNPTSGYPDMVAILNVVSGQ
jgi:hypothetical protein